MSPDIKIKLKELAKFFTTIKGIVVTIVFISGTGLNWWIGHNTAVAKGAIEEYKKEVNIETIMNQNKLNTAYYIKFDSVITAMIKRDRDKSDTLRLIIKAQDKLSATVSIIAGKTFPSTEDYIRALEGKQFEFVQGPEKGVDKVERRIIITPQK
jgi:hypothetical protein